MLIKGTTARGKRAKTGTDDQDGFIKQQRLLQRQDKYNNNKKTNKPTELRETMKDWPTDGQTKEMTDRHHRKMMTTAIIWQRNKGKPEE